MKAKGIPTPQQTEAELTERIEASKVERKDFNKKIDVTIKESKKNTPMIGKDKEGIRKKILQD